MQNPTPSTTSRTRQPKYTKRYNPYERPKPEALLAQTTTGHRYGTRGSVYDEKQESEDLLREIQQLKDGILALDRNIAVTARPTAPPGNRNDDHLHIAFIQMGQGDCTLISTPRGQTILIDCGSTATESANTSWQDYQRGVRGIIYGPKFLHNYNKIDVLILTHPDQDHYNMLKLMLNNSVQIERCYHSCAFSGYSQYQQSTWIWEHMRASPEISIKEVTNATVNGMRSITFTTNNKQSNNPSTSDVAQQDNQTKIDRRDTVGAIRIIEEDNCKVSILASNVTVRSQVRDDGTININSVVVFIEAFGNTILICGDATGGTEDFVRTTYPSIQNIDVLQVPHHGSARTSSTSHFIGKMQPRICIISAPRGSKQHNHPNKSVIIDYLNSGRIEDTPQHEIFYWEGVEGAYQSASRFITKALYITGSYGTWEQSFS